MICRICHKANQNRLVDGPWCIFSGTGPELKFLEPHPCEHLAASALDVLNKHEVHNGREPKYRVDVIYMFDRNARIRVVLNEADNVELVSEETEGKSGWKTVSCIPLETERINDLINALQMLKSSAT